MKARGAEKIFHEIIARNVEGGADSAPPGPFRVKTIMSFSFMEGANVNAIMNHTSSLHMAATNKDADTIELLLDYGANIKALNNRNKTALDLLIDADSKARKILEYHMSKFIFVCKIITCEGQINPSYLPPWIFRPPSGKAGKQAFFVFLFALFVHQKWKKKEYGSK